VLRLPEGLLAEARRMLRDPRARALAVEFGANWLDIRDFAQLGTVDRERFPVFTDEVRSALFEEPVRFLQHIFQNNGSLLDLLYGRYTFVNRVLARYYGLALPAGTGAEAWVRVAAEGQGRAEEAEPGRAAEAARTIHCVSMWIMRAARKIQAEA
jgi:hypothetical protein